LCFLIGSEGIGSGGDQVYLYLMGRNRGRASSFDTKDGLCEPTLPTRCLTFAVVVGRCGRENCPREMSLKRGRRPADYSPVIHVVAVFIPHVRLGVSVLAARVSEKSGSSGGEVKQYCWTCVLYMRINVFEALFCSLPSEHRLGRPYIDVVRWFPLTRTENNTAVIPNTKGDSVRTGSDFSRRTLRLHSQLPVSLSDLRHVQSETYHRNNTQTLVLLSYLSTKSLHQNWGARLMPTSETQHAASFALTI